MSRARARFTEAEIRKAMKVADEHSPHRIVEVTENGVIRFVPTDQRDRLPAHNPRLKVEKDVTF